MPPARPAKPPRPCPICQKMSVADYHPFCSKRCADIDLSRWFKGAYAIPVVEAEDDDSADTTPPIAPKDDDAER